MSADNEQSFDTNFLQKNSSGQLSTGNILDKLE